MRKSDEIKQSIASVRNEVEKLQREEQYDAAMVKAKELKDLTREYEIQAALEAAEFKNFITSDITQSGGSWNAAEKENMERRIFNKLAFSTLNGQTLTDEEKAYINAAGTPGLVEGDNEKGGYLVPDEQFKQILEYRRAYAQLKNYCMLRPAKSKAGKQPTIGKEDGKLINFEEIKEIPKSDFDFGQIGYDIASYGDIIPVSNHLLRDTEVNIAVIIGQRFARKAVNTENEKIVEIITGIEKESIADYKGIQKTINKGLDPAISAASTIYTNQTGYDYLDELEDKQGRPLLKPSLADESKMLFKGKTVVMLSDMLLANDTATEGTTKAPFVVGSMSDMIHFFERQGVEIAISTEAGFTMNTTMLRCIERFDVRKADDEAMKYLQMTIK